MKISFGTESVPLFKQPEHQQVKASVSASLFGKTDTVTISGSSLQLFGQMQQKQTSMIESLMKQREGIQEMKSNLTERTLEKGGDISSIQEQLKQFEQQIAEIDHQMAEMEMEERQKALGKDEKSEEEKSAGTDTQASLMETSQAFDRIETVYQVKNSMEREHRSIASEMKMDTSRGVFSEAKSERLNVLEDRLEDAKQTMMKNMNTVNEPTRDEEENEINEQREEIANQ
ncbi:hypothetical protein ACQKL6_06560 [Peribacillus sp. NPDC097197]|uniref:hypothetical protein n=1 Tax=Peribacillus sp. NPDC097197 TaxID=3390615 RepID=UPI003D0383E7